MIKELAEVLSVDTTKFFKGNKSAGTRARKTAQELTSHFVLGIVVANEEDSILG